MLAFAIWEWIHRLGPAGLILLGLADNSVIPLPGSVDALTIVLAAHKKEWWWMYAIAATIGAVIGGYLTFRLARGGEQALERKKEKLPRKELTKVRGFFRRWGFGSVMIPAMLPPPVPIVPFLITAGAMKYPTRRFLFALSLGRGHPIPHSGQVRAYGKQLFAFFGQYYKPILIALIALAVAGGLVLLGLYLRRRKHKKGGKPAEKAA